MSTIVRTLTPPHTKQIVGLCLVALMLFLAACDAGAPEETATPTAESITTANEAVPTVDVTTGEIVEIDPYPVDQTTGPVRIQIPDIGLDAPIIAMGWRVEMADGRFRIESAEGGTEWGPTGG